MAKSSSRNMVQGEARATLSHERERRWKTTNIHPVERWLIGLSGAALVGYGLFRRDWPGGALAGAGGVLMVRSLSGHSYVYQGLGIDTSRRTLPPGASVPHQQGIKVEKSVTIQRSPQELYQYWRHFENLPTILRTLKDVKILDETHSHWIVQAPAGRDVEWDAVILRDEENELISWRSLPESQIAHAGSVRFTSVPGGRGTVVKVELEYVPPAGRPGALFAKLFGKEPEQQVREGLRHFKELMEAGEIPVTRGQPSGRNSW